MKKVMLLAVCLILAGLLAVNSTFALPDIDKVFATLTELLGSLAAPTEDPTQFNVSLVYTGSDENTLLSPGGTVTRSFAAANGANSKPAYFRIAIAVQNDALPAGLLQVQTNGGNYTWTQANDITIGGRTYALKVATYKDKLPVGETSASAMLRVSMDASVTSAQMAQLDDNFLQIQVLAVDATAFESENLKQEIEVKPGQTFADGAYHIGVAHGAIEKLTPDMKNQYFLMTEAELNAIPVDAWLIGHTHIPYPSLPTDRDETGYRIFNAGTHEQTDVSNNSRGFGFILTLDGKEVRSRAVPTGRIFYPCLTVNAANGTLEQAVREAVADLDERSVVRLILRGTVSGAEYAERQRICGEALAPFLDCEIQDTDLCEELTIETILDTFPETSLAAKLLLELMDDPKEVRMAFDLLQKERE